MSRINWIDSCKGIVIILMVVGHVPHLPLPIVKLIYGFHMPFFFIISGYLFNRDKWHNLGFRQFVSKRLRSYLIPFVVWATVIWIIASVWYASSHPIDESVEKSLFWLYGNIYADGRSAHMPYNGPLWFLPCLFVASVAFFFITMIKNKVLITGIVFLLFICSYFVRFFNLPQLPWHFNGIGYYCALMWGGANY